MTIHKNQLEEAEEALDVLCSIYDDISSRKMEQYSLQRMGISVTAPKSTTKIPEPQPHKTRDLKPYYLEIATKKAKGATHQEIEEEYHVSSSVVHYIIKAVKKTNPEIFPNSFFARKTQPRRNLRPFYAEMVKRKAEGKSVSEIAREFDAYPSVVSVILQRAGIGAAQRKQPEKARAVPAKLTCKVCKENGIMASFISRTFMQKHVLAHRYGKIDAYGKPMVKVVESEDYMPPQPTEIASEELPPPKTIICRICQQEFINMSAYAKHRWIHIKENNEKAENEAARKETPAIEEKENKEKKKLEEELLQSTSFPDAISSDKS